VRASFDAFRKGHTIMSNATRLKLAFRRISAVFAGLIVIFILSTATDVVLHKAGFYPDWTAPIDDVQALVSTSYRIAFSIFGCYVAARLAPDHPMRHALALGVAGVIISLAGALATWNAGLGPRWYALALVVVSMPCAWTGGRLGEARAPSVRPSEATRS
jgi:hypothetical protein